MKIVERKNCQQVVADFGERFNIKLKYISGENANYRIKKKRSVFSFMTGK